MEQKKKGTSLILEKGDVLNIMKNGEGERGTNYEKIKDLPVRQAGVPLFIKDVPFFPFFMRKLRTCLFGRQAPPFLLRTSPFSVFAVLMLASSLYANTAGLETQISRTLSKVFNLSNFSVSVREVLYTEVVDIGKDKRNLLPGVPVEEKLQTLSDKKLLQRQRLLITLILEEGIAPEGWKVDVAALKKGWMNFSSHVLEEYAGEVILIVTSNGIARFAPEITGDFDGFRKEHKIKLSTGALGILKHEGGVWRCEGWNIKPK